MATKQQDANELPASETVSIKCRVTEGEPQSEVKLTVNWDDEKAERNFALRGVKIAAQAMMRASGSIPADLAVSVSELAKRERGGFAMKPTAANAGRLMAKLSDEQYAEALAGIGISAGEVRRMVSARAKLPAAPVGVEAKRAATKPGPVTTTKSKGGSK